MKKKNVNFSEIETLNLNQIKFLKKREIDFKFIFSFIFSILNLIFLIIKKNEKNKTNELNSKNKQLIEKLNSIEMKLKTIKENQIIYQNKFNIYSLLISMEVFGHKKVRIGRKADGGYIFLDDLKNIKFAYSFGISREISFDKELADKNIDVFMYDHTIKGLPFGNSRFHWKKIRLVGINTNNTNLSNIYVKNITSIDERKWSF